MPPDDSRPPDDPPSRTSRRGQRPTRQQPDTITITADPGQPRGGATIRPAAQLDPATREQWAALISTAHRQSVEAILKVGHLLIDAKDALEYGEFLAMIESDLPFGPRTAQMLMTVARDARLGSEAAASYLPPSWTTLYALTRLPAGAFERGIAEGVIRPDMIRADVERLLPEAEPDPEPPVIETEPDTIPLPFEPDPEPATAPRPAAATPTPRAPRPTAAPPSRATQIAPQPEADERDWSHHCFFCGGEKEAIVAATDISAIPEDEYSDIDLPRICEDCARKSIEIIERRRAEIVWVEVESDVSGRLSYVDDTHQRFDIIPIDGEGGAIHYAILDGGAEVGRAAVVATAKAIAQRYVRDNPR
jgi:hypothetical protein